MVGWSLPGEVSSRHRATNRRVLAIGDLTGAVAKAMMNRVAMKCGASPNRAAGIFISELDHEHLCAEHEHGAQGKVMLEPPLERSGSDRLLVIYVLSPAGR